MARFLYHQSRMRYQPSARTRDLKQCTPVQLQLNQSLLSLQKRAVLGGKKLMQIQKELDESFPSF